jgi:hypothetical protein
MRIGMNSGGNQRFHGDLAGAMKDPRPWGPRVFLGIGSEKGSRLIMVPDYFFLLDFFADFFAVFLAAAFFLVAAIAITPFRGVLEK